MPHWGMTFTLVTKFVEGINDRAVQVLDEGGIMPVLQRSSRRTLTVLLLLGV